MADTVDITINPDTWTAVNNSATDGFMTNTGVHVAIYREATSQPSADLTKGHVLLPQQNVAFNSLGGGQSVWSRSISGNSTITMTES